MPDLLTHYVTSLLIATRALPMRHAVLLALVGLLPDVDALLKIHRSATHSLLLVAAAALAIPALRRHAKHTALALAIYALHIVLDVFTAPTPALWPIVEESYAITIKIDGTVADKIAIAPHIEINAEPTHFTRVQAIEGPIISTTGLVVATTTAALLAIEYAAQRHTKKGAHNTYR